MKQVKKSNKRPSKKVTASSRKKSRGLKRFARAYTVAALVIIGVAGGARLLPDSSPLSFASLTGKNTDRVAPKLDTLSGHYSVAGEAASTSLLVKYKESVPEATRASVHKQQGASTKRNIGPLGVDIVKF